MSTRPANFRRDLARAHETDRHPAWLWFSVVMVVLLAALLIWSRFAVIEEVTTGTGQVAPSGRLQVIQSLEGGILADLKVREGQMVERGQPIAIIDPTRANASFMESDKRRKALLATVARLRAEAGGQALAFPAELAGDREFVPNERNTYNARRQALEQSVATLRRSQVLMRQELAITQPMVERGLVPEVEALRLNRQINDAALQVTERVNKYRTDAANDLVKAESDLAQTSEITAGRRDQVDRTTVRAPVRGTIKNLRITTIGGVIQPGGDILEIVPADDELLVEAKIKPADVAFLRPGLKATVKLSAYNYLVYGALPGRVELISPDTLTEQKRPEETFYRVLVRTDRRGLRHDGKQLAVIPGMTASVDILTGRHTLWDYFLRPVMKIEEAFRER